jgi:hypothetical protein
MKIALVIPSYKPHFMYLRRLCESIAQQTRLPDLVIIRASSCDASERFSDVSGCQWPFPLTILTTPNQQFAAQNRNEGVDAVPPDFDVVSFFDSDDFMHPRRLEIMESLFLEGAEAVFHDCQKGSGMPVWDTYDAPRVVWNSILLQKESVGMTAEVVYRPIPMDEELEEELGGTFGHISVSSSIFRRIRFDHAALGYEDMLFASQIVRQGYRTATIRACLSYYYK